MESITMPIVAEESQPKRHRGHWWVMALVLMTLLPVGLFAWSWYEPVNIRIGPRRFTFGALYGNVSTLGPGWHRFPNGWEVLVELPGRTGVYYAVWAGPRKPN